MVASEVQTQGRGRRGRHWRSPKGGLWFSIIIIKPPIQPNQVPILQFIAANSSIRGIEAASGLRLGVKWPNDLILDSRKLGGILVEAKLFQKQVAFAIIGIGINVNINLERLPKGATSLYHSTRRRYRLETMLDSLLKSFASEYEKARDPAEIMREWWQTCMHREKRVQITTSTRTVNGINTGVDLQGHLILETDDGNRTIADDGLLRVMEP